MGDGVISGPWWTSHFLGDTQTTPIPPGVAIVVWQDTGLGNGCIFERAGWVIEKRNKLWIHHSEGKTFS